MSLESTVMFYQGTNKCLLKAKKKDTKLSIAGQGCNFMLPTYRVLVPSWALFHTLISVSVQESGLFSDQA